MMPKPCRMSASQSPSYSLPFGQKKRPCPFLVWSTPKVHSRDHRRWHSWLVNENFQYEKYRLGRYMKIELLLSGIVLWTSTEWKRLRMLEYPDSKRSFSDVLSSASSSDAAPGSGIASCSIGVIHDPRLDSKSTKLQWRQYSSHQTWSSSCSRFHDL